MDIDEMYLLHVLIIYFKIKMAYAIISVNRSLSKNLKKILEPSSNS